jgi:hypothetical protein
MVKKITEETPTVEETPATEETFTPQLMIATAPVEVAAPKLLKVQVQIGTIMFEKGEFRYGAILEVSEDEYRRMKDYVKLVP